MNVYNVRVCNVSHICVHNVRKRFIPEENTRCQGNCVIYIYIYFIWILPLYNGGNHHRGNSGCVLKAMYNAI